MDEPQAIKRCLRNRDPAGFAWLHEHFRRLAYRHACGFLGNADDAADACQESFAKAWASLPRLDELPAFYPWFYRILRNTCFSQLRRRTVARDAIPMLAAGAVPTPDLEEGALRDEAAARVHTALAALAVKDREILVLKYFVGHDYSAISSILGIRRGTVMSRLFHARKRFHEAWVRNGIDAADVPGVEENDDD